MKKIYIIFGLACFILTACSGTGIVRSGSLVSVEYTGTLDTGEIFDSSAGKPLQFLVGAGQVIRGLEDGVIGMKIGEVKDLRIEPPQAYGEIQASLITSVSKERIATEGTPEIGMVLRAKTQTGREVPARITEIGEENVTLDLNHPLAGQVLNFNIKLISIT